MSGPLAGLRVLDLSRVLAGPYCTQMLGDMGAEIIKIEKPFAGDDTRFWGPPFLKDAADHDTKESAYYLSINRNKKSVAVDISKSEGQQIIHRLLESSDILIENFKTGSLEKYGLSYSQIKDQYPRLIYTSITGFGQTGPFASEPGYDLVAQAMGGLMAVTGEKDGAPMKVGVAVSDILTGLHAATAILAALHHRQKSGQGQMIDLSLLDCTLATMTNLAQYYLTSGKAAPRQGNAHATIVPYQAFQASDGWFTIAVGNDSQFKRLCHFIDHDALAIDELFATNPARVQNREILIQELNHKFIEMTVSEIVEACRELDIPAGPVNSLDKVFAEPQVQHNKMQIELDGIALVGSPLKFSETPISYQAAPPSLGKDTHRVLSDLGYDQEIIEKLALDKIIQIPQ